MPEKFDKELQSIDPVKERQVFIDTLVSRLESLDIDDKMNALTLVFAHSINDGFIIAEKLGVSKEEQFMSFIYSAKDKHVLTINDILAGGVSLIDSDRLISDVNLELTKTPNYLSKDSLTFVDSVVEIFNKHGYIRGANYGLPKDIYELIKEYYLPFIQQKRFREVKNDDGYLGRKLAYEVFETRRFAIDKNYPTDLLIKYIKEKTGKDTEFESPVAPEWEVKKKFEKLGLDYDEAVASGAIYVKSPFREVYDVRKKEAIKELKNEIRDNLIKSGHDGDSFEIVEDEDGFKVVEKEVEGKDVVQEVDESKIFEKGDFKEVEINLDKYGRFYDFTSFKDKITFAAKIKNKNEYCIVDNGREFGPYQFVSSPKFICGKLAFQVKDEQSQNYCIYDNKEYGPYMYADGFVEVKGKLAFSIQKENFSQFIYYDGQEIGPFKFAGQIKEIGGKLTFIIKKDNESIYIIHGDEEIGPYKWIGNLTEINRKLSFVFMGNNGKYLINYNGIDSEEFDIVKGLTDIDGKVSFITEKEIGFGPSLKHDVVRCGGKMSKAYPEIKFLIDIDNRPAFIATRRGGKKIINYDNQEISGFEFDSVEIFKYDKETGLLLISGFINGRLITYTKYLKPKSKELKLNSFEQNRLELLNLIKKPDQDKEDDLLLDVDNDQNKRLSTSHQFAQNLNKLIDQDPAIFFDDIRAKGERLPSWRVEQIAERFFPEIGVNKEKERQEKERQKRGSRRSMFTGLFNSFKRENSSIVDNDLFRNNEYLELMDGDPKEKGSDIGIEFRTNVKGMLATNINLGASHDGRWNRLIFPISEELSGPADEVTATIDIHGKNEILLPRFTDSKIITSRIKVLDSKGKDIDFTYDKNSLGQVLVKAIKPIDKILFSQEKPVITPAPGEIEDEEYSIFRKDFESRYGKSVIEDILDLPPELNMFINSILHLSPVEKLIAIEEYVKKISYYDFDNKSVQSLKLSKNNDERLAIMQLRLEDLSDKGINTEGKMFAGVCADFAMLTTALLRKSGFISGVVTGLNMNGKKATSSRSHGLSFIVWPSADGKNEIHIVDGTPGANSPYMSLKERFEEREKNIDVLMKDSDIKLKRMQDVIDSLDIEKIKSLSNGELEEALNVILRYGVKRRNLHVIESILNTKYSPINIAELDLDDMSNIVKVTKMVNDQISLERKKNRKIVDIDIDSGKKLFDTISEFIDRFADREDKNKEQAINRIETIFKISEQFLDPIEAKAVFAVINYLKAKNVK